MRAFRVALVVITSAGLGCFALVEVASALEHGVIVLPVGRRAEIAIEFVQATEPWASTLRWLCTLRLGSRFSE
jgi:hypothetical protein